MKIKAGTCCTSAISGGWRDGANNLASTYTGNTITLQPGPNCGTTIRPVPRRTARPLSNANSNRDDQYRALACDNEYLMGLEMLYIRGPFSFQAEYGWNWLNNASGILAATPAAPNLPRPRTTCSMADTSKWRTR